MEQYSNLNVHGKITQKAAQGTNADDVVKYSTFNPIVVASATPYVSGTTYYKGSLVLTNNGLVYLCKVDSPSDNDDFAITGKVYTADGTTIVLDGTQFKQKSGVVTAGTGITIGTTVVGSATEVPKVKVDTYGRVISIDKVTIYPPTSAGTNGQLWKSDGSGQGVWVNQSAITSGACSGNSATATTLATARSINGTSFDGSADITTSKWGTARNITISDNDGTNTQATNSIDGSANFTLKLPATIKASLSGNATSATKATQDVDGNAIKTTYAKLNSPALTGTPTAPTAAAGTNTDQIATTKFVKTAIDNLPEPMLFKGTVGEGGTITTLPAAAAANEGFTYKAITAHASSTNPVYPAYKVGDTLISNGSAWTVVPSGDEPSGTVTTVTPGTGLTTTNLNPGSNGDAITRSGTIGLANTAVTAGSYGPSANATPGYGKTFNVPYFTVDAQGRLTAASTKTVTIPASDNTHYTANLITGPANNSTSNAANTTTNSIFLNLIEDNTVRNSHNIVGSGGTTVKCDANGKITITSPLIAATNVTLADM